MLVLLHAGILAVRGAYTEHALSWESNVSCLRNAEYQIQNLLNCLRLLSRCFYAQAFWLCVLRNAKQALSWESIVFSSHSEKFHSQNLLLWPPANMKVLLRASFLAVRGPYAEQALSR